MPVKPPVLMMSAAGAGIHGNGGHAGAREVAGIVRAQRAAIHLEAAARGGEADIAGGGFGDVNRVAEAARSVMTMALPVVVTA